MLEISTYSLTFLFRGNRCDYVIEELSVLKNLGQTGKYDYFLYPNEEIEAMKYMSNQYITPKHKDKLMWLQLAFRGLKNKKRSQIERKEGHHQPKSFFEKKQQSTFTRLHTNKNHEKPKKTIFYQHLKVQNLLVGSF